MYPVLFHLGETPVFSYVFFNTLALAVGTCLYLRLSPHKRLSAEQRMALYAGALVGGFIGAKLADVVLNYKFILANLGPYLSQQVGTRSIQGGIIGGYFGVRTAKAITGIKIKTGDPFALAASAGMGIGRIGCLLGGCCLGKPARGWYTVYLAGQHRYPTQLAEAVFDFTLFTVLWVLRDRMRRPGDLFKLFVLCYSVFRFLIEFIRTEPVIWHGLTVYQLAALPLGAAAGTYFLVRYYIDRAPALD